MSLEMLCATMVALIFGLALCFGGYRFFLVLLPIWGFVFGLVLGAETVQAVLGEAFLGTVTSWVVGFFVGALFAVLSYLFYIAGVAFLAASLGYGLGIGIMGAIGWDLALITWIIGVVLAIVFAGLTLYLNIQKYVIIAATAIGGAAIMVGTLIFGAEGLEMAQTVANPVRTMLDGNPLWTIIFLVLAIGGIYLQIVLNRVYVIEPYENRV